MANKIIQLKDSQGNNLYPVMTCNIDELASGTGIEKRILLWTNASPTSEFAAQTLDSSDGIPDLSEYDAVEIVCRYSRTDDTRMRYTCDVGGSSSMYWFYYTATDGKYTGVRSRNVVSVSTTGVAINTCSGKPGNSTTNTANNGYIIPVKIYGIRRL